MRFAFTEKLKTIFEDLYLIYHSHDNGQFEELIVKNDFRKNLQKAEAWERFTEAFNKVSFFEQYTGTLLHIFIVH